VMESDTTTASMSFVIDEDNMASDLATKVPTQQSTKAYADTKLPLAGGTITGSLVATGSVSADSIHSTAGTSIGGKFLGSDSGASLALYDTAAHAFVLAHGSAQIHAGHKIRINDETGTSYTVVNTDKYEQIIRNNASASTQTWPQDSAATELGIGSVVYTHNRGAGTVTHQAGTGATVVGTVIQTQGALCVATKVAANTWMISIGNMPSDTAYATSWNGVVDVAPSKNAVYDAVRAHAFPVYLPAERISSLGGSPSLSQSGGTALDRAKYWLMDAAATETIGGSWLPPAVGVSTINFRIWWAPTSLAGGNVVFKLTYANRTVGEIIHNGSASGSNVVAASPTGSLSITETTLASGLTVTAGSIFRFAIERLGGDGSDTYAADIGIQAAFIDWAS
jgi:hypothetical protein